MPAIDLTLPERRIALTLPDRATNPGQLVTGGTVGSDMILQGFGFGGALDTRAFLLYGLQGEYSTGTAYGFTLRQRRLSLEVE